ncbi:MAG: trigger factor [Anaerolineales bacterium]
MKLDTEFLDTHEAKLTVTVETDQFEGAKRKAAKQLAKKYKIPGFRPGKAPYAVIVKHLGEGSITEQAISNLIDEIYPKAIEEAEVSPYGPGSLEEMASLEPPTFEFKVPLAPEIELPEYKDLRVEFNSKEVTDENIQEVIENLRDSQATIADVDRPVEEGDMVYIVLSGTRKGEKDPEKKELIEERRYPVIVEKKDADQESEYPFPGFSRKLIGLSIGDKKTFQHTFKDDYEFEDLRGVTGMYKVSVEEIKGRSLPVVDDDFAKSVGNYETLEDLKSDIQKTLIEQFESEQISSYESEVMDKLVANAAIKYPPQMLEDEIDDFIHDLEHQLSHQGLNIDLYLKSRNLEMADLRDEVKEQAENRMKRGLILMEVANLENITIPNEEIDQRVERTIQEVAAYYTQEEANRLGSGANLESLRNRIATDEVISRTLKLLRETAMGITQEEESTAEEPEIEADSDTSQEAAEDVPAEAVVETETAEATEPAEGTSEEEPANPES